MKTDSLTYLFMALREKLHRSALRFLRDDEEAKDALQDTFFKLWKNGPPDSESEARNKLFTILKNICIDRLRKQTTFPLNDYDTETMSVMPDDIEDMDRLERLLSTGLTDIQRQIYKRIVHESMEYEEIASELGMSVEAVRMNMSRARKRIRENYQKLNR
ncbi:MAG: RNA polymerase sigma factor [Muribaculaceae bacterium]|nr:RNA polymerase sigma factor [Muribaculaceae bacterium]